MRDNHGGEAPAVFLDHAAVAPLSAPAQRAFVEYAADLADHGVERVILAFDNDAAHIRNHMVRREQINEEDQVGIFAAIGQLTFIIWLIAAGFTVLMRVETGDSPESYADIVALIGCSAALTLSGIPFFGPVAVRSSPIRWWSAGPGRCR